MPQGYRMAFSELFRSDGVTSYLVKRVRSDPSHFKYKAEILSCYPSISHGAAFNTLKLLFPDGCEVTPTPRRPVLQSCYITVSDDSLDVNMLTFIKYSERATDDFAHNVKL